MEDFHWLDPIYGLFNTSISKNYFKMKCTFGLMKMKGKLKEKTTLFWIEY